MWPCEVFSFSSIRFHLYSAKSQQPLPEGALYCKLDPIDNNLYSMILFVVVLCRAFFISMADVKGLLFITDEMIQKWSISVTVIINCYSDSYLLWDLWASCCWFTAIVPFVTITLTHCYKKLNYSMKSWRMWLLLFHF